MFGIEKPEKYLLRKAFEEENILPKEVLWRNKCAFSDGVSSIKDSWHKTLGDFIDSKITDDEFKRESNKFSICKPVLKESYYYRKIYESHFGTNLNLIPHFWMPKWTSTNDPSAREIAGYKE
jgi:asparagine synthase (glutamine-hydrolysing)